MKTEILSLLNIILASPATNAELITSLVLGTIACIIALSIIGKVMKVGDYSYLRTLLVVGLTALVAIPAIAALNIWVTPHLGEAGKIASIVLAVVVVLGVSIPACRFIMDTKFSTSFTIVLLSAGAAAIVVVFSHSGFGAVSAGKKDVDKMLEKRDAARDIR